MHLYGKNHDHEDTTGFPAGKLKSLDYVDCAHDVGAVLRQWTRTVDSEGGYTRRRDAGIMCS